MKVEIVDDPAFVVAEDDAAFKSDTNGSFDVVSAFVEAVLYRLPNEQIDGFEWATPQRIRHVAGR